jgi:formylglycine-generating enzyme required for sulfatase activity
MKTHLVLIALPLLLLTSAGTAGPLEHITINLSDTESIKLVKVPAGKFMMGSPTTQRRRVRDGRETPQREVTISKNFHMSVCEITRGQFAAFVKDAKYATQAEQDGWTFAWAGRVWTKVAGASWKNVGFKQTDAHPVLCVNFDDAVAFCKWMSKRTSRPVRLPTEAQWEYAARAGTQTTYAWGDNSDDGKGWANAADATAKKRFKGWRSFPWDDGHLFTAPVGTYKANAFGLHDVHGNAWEWCADWYSKDYYKNGPKVDPTGPETGSTRVLRGGSWLSSPSRCRVSGRTGCQLQGSYCDLIPSFRIVIEADNSRKLPEPGLGAKTDTKPARVQTVRTGAKTPAHLPQTVKALKTLTLTLGKGAKMKFVRIPPGKFMMGSPNTEKDRTREEGPQRQVTISKPFYMGVTEVTQAQFRSLVRSRSKPNRYGPSQAPAETLSWKEATVFCRAMSKKTGRTVCLPTEAQWEYACRAGAKTRFAFGDDDKDLDAYGWSKANSPRNRHHPVSLKKPNAFGLYDMHGNVWEWCSDRYAESYEDAETVDPKGPAAGQGRVLRGGAANYASQFCRSAGRYWGPPDAPCYDWGAIGFRVVITDVSDDK